MVINRSDSDTKSGLIDTFIRNSELLSKLSLTVNITKKAVDRKIQVLTNFVAEKILEAKYSHGSHY